MAVTRPIKGYDSVMPRRAIEQSARFHVNKRYAIPMEQDERTPLPTFDIMEMNTVDFEELARWRILLLGLPRLRDVKQGAGSSGCGNSGGDRNRTRADPIMLHLAPRGHGSLLASLNNDGGALRLQSSMLSPPRFSTHPALDRVQRLDKIGDEIVRILYPDRDADQILTDAQRFLSRWGDGEMRHRRRMAGQRFRAA